MMWDLTWHIAHPLFDGLLSLFGMWLAEKQRGWPKWSWRISAVILMLAAILNGANLAFWLDKVTK
jgi:hypothetical protein